MGDEAAQQGAGSCAAFQEVTDPKIARLIHLRLQCKAVGEIALDLKCTERTVHNLIRAHNVDAIVAEQVQLALSNTHSAFVLTLEAATQELGKMVRSKDARVRAWAIAKTFEIANAGSSDDAGLRRQPMKVRAAELAELPPDAEPQPAKPADASDIASRARAYRKRTGGR